MTVIQ